MGSQRSLHSAGTATPDYRMIWGYVFHPSIQIASGYFWGSFENLHNVVTFSNQVTPWVVTNSDQRETIWVQSSRLRHRNLVKRLILVHSPASVAIRSEQHTNHFRSMNHELSRSHTTSPSHQLRTWTLWIRESCLLLIVVWSSALWPSWSGQKRTLCICKGSVDQL